MVTAPGGVSRSIPESAGTGLVGGQGAAAVITDGPHGMNGIDFNYIHRFGFDNHCHNYNVAAETADLPFRFAQVTDVISDTAARFSNGAGGLYISKSCKNVEKAFEVLACACGNEGMKLLMWGIEGEDYALTEEGCPVLNYQKTTNVKACFKRFPSSSAVCP